MTPTLGAPRPLSTGGLPGARLRDVVPVVPGRRVNHGPFAFPTFPPGTGGEQLTGLQKKPIEQKIN